MNDKGDVCAAAQGVEASSSSWAGPGSWARAGAGPRGDDATTVAVPQPAESALVRVSWGEFALCVKEMNESRRFVIARDDRDEDVDFVVPPGMLSEECWVLLRREGASWVVAVPAAASGQVNFPCEGEYELDAVRAGLVGSVGGHELVLTKGMTMVLVLGSLRFEIEATTPEPRWSRSLVGDSRSTLAFFGMSALSTGGLLAAMAFLVPPLGVTDGEGIHAERLYLIQQYLDAAAMREESAEEPRVQDESRDSEGGKEGAQATGEEGVMGKTEPTPTKGRFSVQGPKHHPEPELRRRSEAETFGMVGLLTSGQLYDGPTAPWARSAALGDADQSALGSMWADDIGEASGLGGLGLLGAAEGGGGAFQGVGLGDVGTIAGGLGSCDTGQSCAGFGTGHGRVAGGRKGRAPRVRMASPTVNGRLPPEAIQRIVRQNFGKFRMCYEQGLRKNPTLEGRVSVRFLISSQGTVSRAVSSGSALPDSGVVECVTRGFYGLSFPKPEQGSVSVTYPLMFSPG